MVKAIIFDCFGVLATEGWLPFKSKYFGDNPELFARATEIGHQADKGLMDRGEAVRQTSELAGVTPAEFLDEVGRNVPNEELFSYMKELKPGYRLGFLSNISDNYLHQIFPDDHLALFDHLELSYKSGVIKPEAGAYRNAAAGLGLEPAECVMVDDQERNVAGAREAGMKAVLYKNVDQLREDLAPLLEG